MLLNRLSNNTEPLRVARTRLSTKSLISEKRKVRRSSCCEALNSAFEERVDRIGTVLEKLRLSGAEISLAAF